MSATQADITESLLPNVPVITSGSSLLDDPREWGEVIPQPSDVNVKQFQTYLNRLCGRNAEGKPIMRLVWGWSEEAREWRAGDWRFKYRFHTVYLKTQDMHIDLAVPRWFLEELIEPVQYLEQWNAHRYAASPNGSELVDVLGPPPVERGWYQHARTIAIHDDDRRCCNKLWDTQRRTCWGFYRPPGELDLSVVSHAVLQRDAERQLNRGDEPLSPEVFKLCSQAQFEAKREREERIDSRVSELIDDTVRTHKFSWTSDDPSVLKHGKFHFLQNPSGLFVPPPGDQ
jgi:hypothetical protein